MCIQWKLTVQTKRVMKTVVESFWVMSEDIWFVFMFEISTGYFGCRQYSRARKPRLVLLRISLILKCVSLMTFKKLLWLLFSPCRALLLFTFNFSIINMYVLTFAEFLFNQVYFFPGIWTTNEGKWIYAEEVDESGRRVSSAKWNSDERISTGEKDWTLFVTVHLLFTYWLDTWLG